MSYKIERFKWEHLEQIIPRPELKGEVDYALSHEEYKRVYLRDVIFCTLKYNDEIVLIYGLHNSGLGTYVPMLVPSMNIGKHRFAAIRSLYKYYEDFVGSDIRRFEAYATIEDKVAVKFAKFFGFEIIGIRHCSSVEGKDQVIFERVHRKA